MVAPIYKNKTPSDVHVPTICVFLFNYLEEIKAKVNWLRIFQNKKAYYNWFKITQSNLLFRPPIHIPTVIERLS